MRLFDAVVLLLVVLACSPLVRADAHFEACTYRTGNNATVIIPSSAVQLDGAPLALNDEVAVFTPDGTCAGYLVWNGGNAALAVWADDPSTDAVEGFVPGQPLHYSVWDESAGVQYGVGAGGVQVEYDDAFTPNGVYHPDAIYLVSAIAVDSETLDENAPADVFALAPNFPNPFAGRTKIGYALPEAAHVKLEVYDLLGHRVDVLVDEFMDAGRYDVELVADAEWSSGVYVYRLQAGQQSSYRKMTLTN